MVDNSLVELLKDKFGLNLYKKSSEFPTNKINIISFEETPINIRCIILDEDREFHLIIDEKNYEIFHDCPTFLIHTELGDKICIHILKLLLILKEKISLKIFRELKKYNLTSEDGSKKKSDNFLILANSCLDGDNYVEGLSYLNKAIINQYECEPIIENYLKIALKNNLFIEFFEFLKSAYENDLGDYLIKYRSYIDKGFKLILSAIWKYDFFDVLRIIQFIDKILDVYQFEDFSLLSALIDKLIRMTKSDKFNERYFSIFFIKKNLKRIIELKPSFEKLISSKDYLSFNKEILNYFLNEIESFSVIEKIKLMKNQFEIFNIPKADYYEEYKRYKAEIRELERKVYLRKFAFLKLIAEHHNLKKTKVDFRKKRNTYVITHNKENLKVPVYSYIIKHIGFYGLNESTIKSSEIGINYFIIKELFLDDLNNYPDIFYYKNQFWGEDEEYIVNSIDGFSLISKLIENGYDISQKFSDFKNIIIIEWDLASKPCQANIVNAYGSQIVIPDQNNPLFHDLKPFDLCYCQKNPVKIEGNIIKTINVITKCSFKDAINSVSSGMEFIEGYYPLSVIKLVLNKKISPFEADEIVYNNQNKSFIPNYNQFIKNFREFLFNFITQEKEYIFNELKTNPEIKTNQIISLLNLTTELAGLNLSYTDIIKDLFSEDINLQQFRKKFLDETHSLIKRILTKREFGATEVFKINKMKNTPFMKYSDEIIKIRKEEFEKSTIYKSLEDENLRYDIANLHKTYYGRKLSQILNLGSKNLVNQDYFNKINKFANKLNLKLDVKNSIN
ncbi:MAG: hypothetical protein ACFE8M_06755 [Candidatus Hermodarchaeota archaeon]